MHEFLGGMAPEAWLHHSTSQHPVSSTVLSPESPLNGHVQAAADATTLSCTGTALSGLISAVGCLKRLERLQECLGFAQAIPLSR